MSSLFPSQALLCPSPPSTLRGTTQRPASPAPLKRQTHTHNCSTPFGLVGLVFFFREGEGGLSGFGWFFCFLVFSHCGCCTSFIGKIDMKPHKRWNMLFLLKNFHWTLMVSIQSLTYKLLQADVHTCARGRRWQRPGVRDGFCVMHWEPTIHLPAFWAFWADLVTFPAPPLFFSTFLMTPTATVCLMSRTAKRPEGHTEGE